MISESIPLQLELVAVALNREAMSCFKRRRNKKTAPVVVGCRLLLKDRDPLFYRNDNVVQVDIITIATGITTEAQARLVGQYKTGDLDRLVGVDLVVHEFIALAPFANCAA